MDAFKRKELQVARGYTYTYYTSPASDAHDSPSPGLLFLHGWPDSAELWQYVAPQLLPLAKKHRMIIPDLLGAGNTSKPTHSPAYTFSYMTQDLVEILRVENVKTVIPIGHDWGSVVAQRFCLYAPEHTVGLILLNVAYVPPSSRDVPTIDTMNESTRAAFGYNAFEYMRFFITPAAAALMDAHPEKCWDICHGDEDDWMMRMFCTEGGMQKYLEDDSQKIKRLKPYAEDEKLRKTFIDGVKNGGMQGRLMYYRAHFDGCQVEAEKAIPKDRMKLNYPVLFIGCDKDVVCRKEAIKLPERMGLLPDLQVVEIDSGHWCAFEKPKEVAAAITDFLKEKF